MKIGAHYLQSGLTRFTVWAPRCISVSLKVIYPEDTLIPMKADEYGYWNVEAPVKPGSRYFYRLNSTVDRPDPASRFQSQGVHGPSEVISNDFSWNDSGWTGIALEKYIIYELHIGTFTKEGTFEGVEKRIKYLKELGITAIEMMPVAQFPGERNWGYDGAYHFAVQNSYGGANGLKRFVDECHKKGYRLYWMLCIIISGQKEHMSMSMDSTLRKNTIHHGVQRLTLMIPGVMGQELFFRECYRVV